MDHSIYMNRCLELAKLGAGYVAPNPMVGAVLVYEDRIIGEGYHQEYGKAHAEVNCLAAVSNNDHTLISQSTLYVSLEPCAHFGKTPPCADLIIKHKIPKLVIGCKDPFAKVNGLGIKKLRDAGIEVVVNILEDQALELNKRFFCFHQHKRPFIILKWAQTADGFIAKENYEAVAISNAYTKKWVHKMRGQEAAIMVGNRTAVYDNPALTTREWPGKNPVRITIDKNLELPASAAIKNIDGTVFIFNDIKEAQEDNIHYIKIDNSSDLPDQLVQLLYEHQIQSLIIEGGAKLIQSFIDKNLWDECFCIINPNMFLQKGIPSPDMTQVKPVKQFNFDTDQISYFKNQQF